MGQERGTVAALCGAEVLTTAGPTRSAAAARSRSTPRSARPLLPSPPLAAGLALDLTGNGATVSWRVARFLVLAAGVALGPLALWLLGRRTRGA